MFLTDLNEIQAQPVSHNPEIKKFEMLKYLEVPHLAMFSQAVFESGQMAKAHSHDDMWETFFIEEGSGIIEVNEKAIKVSKGNCLTVEPRELHTIINNSNNRLVITYFGIVR